MTRPSKPTLTVLYGRADRFSTSYQTTELVEALRPWFEPRYLRLGAGLGRPWRGQAKRLWRNLLLPSLTQPRTDYLLYGNDGLGDLRCWRARRILYWYDAPWNYAVRRPRPHQFIDWLRCRNVIVADQVFAVSQAQVRLARSLRPAREQSVCYLPVGVDCRFFDPAKASPDAARQRYRLGEGVVIGYLGYLGYWRERFAGEPLVEIAPRLLARQPVHFLVVGSGPAEDLFRQRVAEMGLNDHFTFTGFVEAEWLPHCLAAMDICVDTLEEGFHSEARSETKLKQYMAMGRACVATALGENRVDLEEGKCGVLVKPGAQALLEGIQGLCQDLSRREQLGSAARRRAEAVYAWPRLAERLATGLGLQPTGATPAA
jgi:glycosyltransferase involved in cell wall biosynthesis